MGAAQLDRIDRDQPIFDALADPTRRALISVLAANERITISALSAHVPVTRQAVSKHLQVIEAAGMVTIERQGRERLLTFSPAPLGAATAWMRQIESEWDTRLARLRAFLVDEMEQAQPTLTEPQ